MMVNIYSGVLRTPYIHVTAGTTKESVNGVAEPQLG
jgi:hypothetical protein